MKRRTFVATAAAAGASFAVNPRGAAKDWTLPTIARYPDPAIEIVDPRFEKYRVGNAAIERLYTGARWSEGPVWFGDGRYLVWSDIPNNRMLRWLELTGEVSVFRYPSNYTNGNTRDKQGRLISCEHDARRVTRTELDGTITVLIDHYQSKPFNAPNDVVVHSNGSIWFTDPGYGIMGNYEGHKAAFELPANVYRLDPKSGEVAVVVGDMRRPNGLCFSPDETKLYIVDTGMTDGPQYPHNIRVYDVVEGARLANGRVFVEMGAGLADGIRCDVDGNVWAGTGWGGEDFSGVQVLAPEGKLIGKVHLPEICANICFGGAKRNRLFMVASTSLYSVYVGTQGAQTP
ncbi:MAG: SMP-30/gluconolactonase/LRE family protein [Acidobacteriia bacterium]|nr:SMP-30/gluconolactonase/LRE family protein [Terriglobia bacterium]